MHSRIFQVSTEFISTDEYIREDDYYDHWFTSSIADYVDGDCNRGEDIEWLRQCVKGIVFGKDDDGEYFIVENKEEYFARNFERFKNALDKIKGRTITDFANGIPEVWTMKDAYENKFGFYVDTDDYGLESFDEFVRHSDIETKYYIGGIVDYHF